jgi:hypothetical protein
MLCIESQTKPMPIAANKISCKVDFTFGFN